MSAHQHDPGAAHDQFAAEQHGFQKGLGARQLQMIAIGSAIGTGLFLGTGSRLQAAGPTLAILFAVCGFFGYLILRSLGELIVHRPSSGSFVSYTREFYGERSAYVSGWLYWLNWAMTAVADATALALYIAWFEQYQAFAFLAAVPQWVLALIVVVLVTTLNLVSVKVFGEMEFWFSLIKILALVIFLIVGSIFVVFGAPNGQPTGLNLIQEGGGMLPNGLLPAIVVMQGVVFSYAGIELVGTTAGETADVKRLIPRAINSVILRIAVFYVGSVVLLCLLLPYSAYSADESPFVTFFSSVGFDAAGPIMQLVVITAAMSSMNAGIYSTGRILHSMSTAGSAPRFAQRMNAQGVPVGGILLTAGVGLIGVLLNLVVPEQAFEVVLNISAIGTMASWAAIAMCHQRFLVLTRQGVYARPDYRAPGGRAADYAVLVFIAVVMVLIAFDYPVGTWTLVATLGLVPLLVGGWFACRGRVREIAAQRHGFTGPFPVIARTPGTDARGPRARSAADDDVR